MAKFFAVFSGGGMKGAALLGAYEEAEKSVQFVGWGGTSAGSIVAALLACGYSSTELRTQLHLAPYPEFFQIRAMRLLLLNRYRGMVDPQPLLRWLRGLIGAKFPGRPRVTFGDLADSQFLKIVAANITTQEIVIYSKATTPGMEIAQAVLASCSFPLLFPPVTHGQDDVVDGGVFSNFPMWLFDAEHEHQNEFIPVLGFALVSKAKVPEANATIAGHVFSIFDSILAAQDRIQEKYMEVARLSNVIRIDVGDAATFGTSQAQHDRLVLAGKDAASRYFEKATRHIGQPVVVPFVETSINAAMEQARLGHGRTAVSIISRQHILHGGVARDDGFREERILVNYYLDLMGAVTNHHKLEILAEVMASRLRALEFDRVVGIKRGNIILSYAVARILKKPISLFKHDMSYKMGPPFDGELVAGESAVVVDDIASDASVLLNVVRHLHFRHVQVNLVATLIERAEGDARSRIMKERGVPMDAVCLVDDVAIRKLIEENVTFSDSRAAVSRSASI